jgi:hypothetical protein
MTLSKQGCRMAAMALAAAAAGQAHADISFSIGTGFVFGGRHCGWGWGGPVISIGTTWYSGSCRPRCYDGWRDCGYGWSRPSYCAPVYVAPSYCDSYRSGVSVGVSARLAEAPCPVAPAVPAEANVDRGWRLLEAGDTGAMEAFGRAVARSEGDGRAHLGYAICAANAGQLDRADWAARTALKKDADVIAKLPQGGGVAGAAEAAIARLREARGKSGGFALATLSELTGEGRRETEPAVAANDAGVNAQETVGESAAARAGAEDPVVAPIATEPLAPAAPLLPPSAPTQRVVVPVTPQPK